MKGTFPQKGSLPNPESMPQPLHQDMQGTEIPFPKETLDVIESMALQDIAKKLSEGSAYRVPAMKDGRATGYYIKEYVDQNPDPAKREKGEKDPILRFTDEQGILDLADKSGDRNTFLEKIGMLDDEEKGH